MKNKLLIFILLLGLLFPSTRAFANPTVVPGDGGYAEGMYLVSLSSFSSTRGMQANPYGESKSGLIGKEEMEELLKDKKINALVEAYNKLYQSLMKLYKYGDKRMDRWKEVRNMEDPVFGKINKKTFVETYNSTASILQEVRLYFDSIGLEPSRYNYRETLEMIDREELEFCEVKIIPQ